MAINISPGSYACASSGRRQDDAGRICAYLARYHEDEELEEERDEFISVVSHELRTPIAIAEGSLSNAKLLVERKMTSKIPEANRRIS